MFAYFFVDASSAISTNASRTFALPSWRVDWLGLWQESKLDFVTERGRDAENNKR
jgi:hypothetical protein